MMYLSEAAMAVQGSLRGQDVLFTGVSTDSRTITPGQLFVALRGEHFDGHAYAKQCLEKGAAAILLDNRGATQEAAPALVVADTRLALGQLAAYWRSKFAIPVAAITGSNGKTTVKEMLASILRAQVAEEVQAEPAQAVLATQGNLNNDIGVPLTLFCLGSQHRFAVIEMGMNHEGEISYLTRIAKPTVALVNNATAAHLGGLGSVEAIARAKGEIFAGLAEGGIAVINADDAFAGFWHTLAVPHKVLTFGLRNAADVSADYVLGTDASTLRLHTPQGENECTLPVAGLHNVYNALAATAAALAMGAGLPAITRGLAGFGGVKGRLQRKPGFNGALVIDDTYNANPASMKAAIDVLATMRGNRILVLGDMGELGEGAASLHADVGRYAKRAGASALYVLGELSQHMTAAFGTGARHFTTPELLAAELRPHMDKSVTVLVKGSRFMRMERVVGLIGAEQQKGEHNAA